MEECLKFLKPVHGLREPDDLLHATFDNHDRTELNMARFLLFPLRIMFL